MIFGHHRETKRWRAWLLVRALSLVLLLIAANEVGFAQSPAPSEAAGQKAAPRPLPNLELIQELTRPHGTSSLTWSSDGSKLAAYMVAPGPLSVDGKLLTVWNADGQILREIEPPDFFFSSDDPLAFVAGGKQLATTPWFKSITLGFMVFDIESGKVVREIEGPERDRGRPDNAAVALASSPDQSILAVVFGRGRSHPVALYSTRDWSKVATLMASRPTHPKELAFSPDGRFLAVIDLWYVRIYDIVSKQRIQVINPFDDGLTAVQPFGPEDMAFSPDGTLIAVAAAHAQGPKIANPLRIFRVDNGARVGSSPIPLTVIHRLAWSLNGHVIAFTAGWGKDELHLWDPSQPENERVVTLVGYANSLAFSPDGARLAVTHGSKVAIYRITP
jgi:WD40 repeat protein